MLITEVEYKKEAYMKSNTHVIKLSLVRSYNKLATCMPVIREI